ncbi:hypothetical protein PMAYCL1PPCAC_02390 [Pristionchus mayeri]|uniref:Uncharacterized protein n=1 Tax=Pristionchus mayeri TaxID=1317129 RepID=A0AAN5C670_9BILA|nr:hypothetical protein PMAYCL1PPCAC_02390 [Pristionchus mayeri]
MESMMEVQLKMRNSFLDTITRIMRRISRRPITIDRGVLVLLMMILSRERSLYPLKDWRPETPSPPSSDEVLPMREVFTLIPQTPDTEYPDPEWAGEERTTKRPLTTTERPWETTTRTARPWWETTTTQRPWWETTDRPWWETTTTQKPSWESSTTPQSRWMTSTTQQPRWEYSTALPWWISSTRPSSLSNQREKSRRLPIPRRASLGCRMLNPLIDGKSHPDNDSSCILDEVIQSGCSCRYLRGENDERGCARYFLTLCTRR